MGGHLPHGYTAIWVYCSCPPWQPTDGSGRVYKSQWENEFGGVWCCCLTIILCTTFYNWHTSYNKHNITVLATYCSTCFMLSNCHKNYHTLSDVMLSIHVTVCACTPRVMHLRLVFSHWWTQIVAADWICKQLLNARYAISRSTYSI